MPAEQDIGRIVVELLLKDKRFNDGLKNSAKNTRSFGKDMESLANKMAGSVATGFRVAAAAVAGIGIAMGAMGKAAIATGSKFETFEARLTTLLGSADLAKVRMDELFRVASSTPFSLEQVVEADVTLEAFGANVEGAQVGVMNLAGAMGLDLVEAASGVGRAFAGGAGAADLLRDRGVLAMVELRAGMKAADMTAEQFQQTLLAVLNEDLAGGAERLAATYEGAISNIEDEWTRFTKGVADSGFFDGVKGAARGLLNLIEANRDSVDGLAQEIGENLTAAMFTAIKAVGGLVDGWGMLKGTIVLSTNDVMAFAIEAMTAAREWNRLLEIGGLDRADEINAANDSINRMTVAIAKNDRVVDDIAAGIGEGAKAAEDMISTMEDAIIAGRGARASVLADTEARKENTDAMTDQEDALKDAEDALKERMKAERELRSLLMDTTDAQREFNRLLFQMADGDAKQALEEMAEGIADLPIEEQGEAFRMLTNEIEGAAEAGLGMGAQIAAGLQQAGQGVRSFVSGFKGAIGTVQSVLSTLTGTNFNLGSVISGATGEDPRSAVAEMTRGAREFALALAENIDVVAVGFVNAIPRLSGPLAKAAEGLIRAVVTNLPKLVGGIIKSTRSLSARLVPQLFAAVSGLLGQLPKFLRRILRDSAFITDLITDGLDVFMAAFMQMVPDLITAILDTSPALVEAGVRLMTTLAVEFATQFTIAIVPRIPEIVWAILKAVVLGFGAVVKGMGRAFWEATVNAVGSGGGQRSAAQREADALASQQAMAMFNDTPGAIQAGMRGLMAGFAPGDFVVAAQSPAEVLRQALQLNQGASSSSASASPPPMPPSAGQSVQLGLTIMAEGQVLEQSLVTAGERGRAPAVQRAFNAGAGIQVGFDQGGFVLQTP